MSDQTPNPVSPEPDPTPEPTGPGGPAAAQRSTNKRQAWLYVIIGAALSIVAVLGLMADDRGVLDWLLLVLGLINLGLGVMALRRPEPRLGDPSGH